MSVDQVAAVQRVIDGYVPDGGVGGTRQVATFVRDVVSDARPSTVVSARAWLAAVAGLARWALLVGYDLDRSVVLQAAVVDEYCRSGMDTASAKSRATVRSRLFRIGQRLSVEGGDELIGSIGRGPSAAPYTAREVRQLRSWSENLATSYQTVNAAVLLALGLGAGLSSRELCGVRAKHVTVHGEAVVVDVVEGDRPRSVPLLTSWQGAIAELAGASMRRDQFLFRPRREERYNINAVVSFIYKVQNPPVPVLLSKMRATWLALHLAAGTPLGVLLDTAGLRSLDPLEHVLPFVPNMDWEHARAWMRRPGLAAG